MSIAPTILSPEERFIELLSGNQDLQSQEEEIIKELLITGGFTVTALAKGKVYGRQLVSQDERVSYVANPASGYKAVDQFGTNEPSSWLEMFWSETRGLIANGQRDKALTFLREQLQLCRPLRPVVVNAFGETFKEYYRQAREVRSTDETPLTFSYVIHAYCNGFTDIKDTTLEYNIIVCRSCHLRVYVPKSVVTWGDLRKHFSQYNE